MSTDTLAPVKYDPKAPFAGILSAQETFGSDDPREFGNRINTWFDQLMIQSGIPMAPTVTVLLCLLGILAFGGGAFVLTENLLATALFTILGFFAPLSLVMFIRGRRQTKMLQQLPPMIDELARAAKTGRSLEQCLQVVATDTPQPLGKELKICTDKLRLGVPITDALATMPERTGLVSTSVLATALIVHQQTGGDLVRVLERLARTLRDRLQFVGRLRTATAASRATAFLMIGLPPAILLFFTFRDPNYLGVLWASKWGSMSVAAGTLLTAIGAFWVIQILNRSQRT